MFYLIYGIESIVDIVGSKWNLFIIWHLRTKKLRFTELQNRISGEKHREYEGKTLRVLVDGETGREEYNLSSRTNGGRLVHLKGDPSLIGRSVNVRITASNTWALYGETENG